MIISWLILFSSIVFSADSGTAAPISSPAAIPARDVPERNFYEVLEDVMGDFEYDLKHGDVYGLKDLAIRNVATSENIPPSFKNHLELLITERILRNSKTHVIALVDIIYSFEYFIYSHLNISNSIS